MTDYKTNYFVHFQFFLVTQMVNRLPTIRIIWWLSASLMNRRSSIAMSNRPIGSVTFYPCRTCLRTSVQSVGRLTSFSTVDELQVNLKSNHTIRMLQ